jgi:uncharacterized protein
MISAFLDKKIKYDGSQLSSLWAYKNFGILGDSIVSFIGPCNIPEKLMVDVEDVRAKHKICGSLMLHFIIEHFDTDLAKVVLKQRLFAAIIKDELETHIKRRLIRAGDDLYDADSKKGKAKLSISIATASPVSTLIHFAVNISTKGTPVKTAGLNDYRIEPKGFAVEVMSRYTKEMQTVKQARQKVNWVK